MAWTVLSHICFKITLLFKRRLTGTFFQHKISIKNYCIAGKAVYFFGFACVVFKCMCTIY